MADSPQVAAPVAVQTGMSLFIVKQPAWAAGGEVDAFLAQPSRNGSEFGRLWTSDRNAAYRFETEAQARDCVALEGLASSRFAIVVEPE